MPKTVPIQSDNEVLNNIFHLMKVKAIRQVDLANHLGISRNAITQWKTKQTKSYMNYIDQLAAYFDVSKNDLLHPKKNNLYESFLSDEERQVIQLFRTLTDNQKTAVSNLLISISENG